MDVVQEIFELVFGLNHFILFVTGGFRARLAVSHSRLLWVAETVQQLGWAYDILVPLSEEQMMRGFLATFGEEFLWLEAEPGAENREGQVEDGEAQRLQEEIDNIAEHIVEEGTREREQEEESETEEGGGQAVVTERFLQDTDEQAWIIRRLARELDGGSVDIQQLARDIDEHAAVMQRLAREIMEG